MNSLGARLNYIRKQRGYTQTSLATAIGVSRGVIFNLEKNKTEPQMIVINAICHILNINKEWLLNGIGEMDCDKENLESNKILNEIFEVTKDLSEDELFYLLDIIKALKNRLRK